MRARERTRRLRAPRSLSKDGNRNMREQKREDEITLMGFDHYGIGQERKQGALNLLLLVWRVRRVQVQTQ